MSQLLSRPKTQEYVPIHLDSLRVDTILAFDLYIKIETQMTLYRSADLPFTDKTRRRLLEHGLDVLYISDEARGKFQEYMETNLPVILQSPDLPQQQKATVLYDTSKTLIQDVFANPTYNDNIRRSQKMVTNTIEYLLQGREAFVNLLQITSYDYTLYTHSVNVCTFSLALARQVGYTDEKFLYELGVGALLHDIGKSRISERILNKPTRLSVTEFEIVKKHPQWGVEILRDTNTIPENSYFPVLEHHERGGGEGYPKGLDLSQMHIYSKILAIADSFDAMTTRRAYQNAMDTYPALRLMNAQRNAFDPELLREFIYLLGPDGK